MDVRTVPRTISTVTGMLCTILCCPYEMSRVSFSHIHIPPTIATRHKRLAACQPFPTRPLPPGPQIFARHHSNIRYLVVLVHMVKMACSYYVYTFALTQPHVYSRTKQYTPNSSQVLTGQKGFFLLWEMRCVVSFVPAIATC